jgi:hypothetical protein
MDFMGSATQFPPLDEPGRIASDHSPGRHIVEDRRLCAHDGTLSDRHSHADEYIRGHPGTIANGDRG